MKKGLILLLITGVLGAGAWLGSTWWIGVQTEQWVKQHWPAPASVSRAQDKTPVLQLLSYERSLLGAQARTVLDVRDTPLDAWVDELPLRHEIRHGPLWWRADDRRMQAGLLDWHTQLDLEALDSAVLEQLVELFAGQPPLQVQAQLDFEQWVNLQADLSGFMALTSDGEGEIRLAGAQARGRFQLDTPQAQPLLVNFGQLDINNSEVSLRFPDLQVSLPDILRQDATRSGFSFQAAQVEWQPAAFGTPIRFDLQGDSFNHFPDQDLQGELRLVLNRVQGLDYPLQEFQARVEYGGLHHTSLQRLRHLQNRVHDLQAQLDWLFEEAELPETQRRMLELERQLDQAAVELLEALFHQTLQAGRSQLSYQLRVDSGQGRIEHQATLDYAGAPRPLHLQDLMRFGLQDWAQLWRGDMTLHADRAALPVGLERWLRYPLRQQALLEQDGQYSLELQLQGDNVQLNGEAMDYVELAGRFSRQPPALTEDANAGIPPDILAMIEQQGLSNEVMQQLEESDDVSADALDMLRQLQEMSQQLQ
ncbi:MAG: DUF945 family protein [Thiolinea sp.]